MHQNPDLKMLFVINPVSGGIQKNDYAETIQKLFPDITSSLSFFYLKGQNDASELQKTIEKIMPHVVVAVGGDGTVSMVAKKLAGTEIKLGIIPAGSANGMAKELNIPVVLEEAVEIIKKGIHRKIDVLNVNNQMCLHLSDIGINAQLIKHFESGKTRGKLGYAKVAFKVLLRKRTIRVSIQTDTTEIKREAFMVVLANASKYGTGAVINPKGDLYDGLFEVVIMRKISLPTLYKMWFKPHAFKNDQIEVFQAKSVNIEAHKKIHFQVDGEYLGKVLRVRAEILPAQLAVLLPD